MGRVETMLFRVLVGLLGTIVGYGAPLYSGWMQNTTYANLDCSGAVKQLSLTSFDTCFFYPNQPTGSRLYCEQASSSSWNIYERQYSDSTCTNPRAVMTTPVPTTVAPTCDGSGNAVKCVSDLSSAPLTSAPRGFIESRYWSSTCDESKIFERLIVPMGGCTLIQVERTDTMPNGVQIPLGPTFAYFKIDSCEWVNNGYVAFGSLHTDNRCSSPGSATSHVLPRGCMESAVNTALKLSATFTCG